MLQMQYQAAEQKALFPTELRNTCNIFMQILKSLGAARGRASSGPFKRLSSKNPLKYLSLDAYSGHKRLLVKALIHIFDLVNVELQYF